MFAGIFLFKKEEGTNWFSFLTRYTYIFVLKDQNQGNSLKNSRFLVEKFNGGFNTGIIGELARETGFAKRKPKFITQKHFPPGLCPSPECGFWERLRSRLPRFLSPWRAYYLGH